MGLLWLLNIKKTTVKSSFWKKSFIKPKDGNSQEARIFFTQAQGKDKNHEEQKKAVAKQKLSVLL